MQGGQAEIEQPAEQSEPGQEGVHHVRAQAQTGRNDGVAEAERVGRDLGGDRDDEGNSKRQPQRRENSRCCGRKRDLDDLVAARRAQACGQLRKA